MKVFLLAFFLIPLFIVPAFSQQMGYYENSEHGFSMNYPVDWTYEEDIEVYENLPPFQVWFYVPSDIIDTDDFPHIGVMYEFISSSSVPTLNERTVENYVSEQIISSIPTGRLTSSSVESKSWGWVVSTEFFETIPTGETLTLFYDVKSYFFKNGDLYNLEYSAGERYFDTYHPEFETVLGSLVIKGTEVNEPERETMTTEMQQKSSNGGCLIATATFGSELAPQVQMLREIRDNALLTTTSGSSFMSGFNTLYYSFSPAIADLERQSPIFREAVKITITPLLASLSLLNHVDMDSEEKVLGYGISIILLNAGMYFVAPAIVITKLRKRF